MIERGKKYIPQQIRSANKATKRNQKREKDYFSDASRKERRIQKSIKNGLTIEEAKEEAELHFKTLRDRQRGRIP